MEPLNYVPPEMVPSRHGDAAPVDLDGPVEIADRVWWVGSMHRDEVFQCHPYLIEAGSDSARSSTAPTRGSSPSGAPRP